ncbi:2-dehydro-3-deoxyglucarate aldolase [Bipolaris maydis]|nr:2-dehydro-3-deoxyglucarate aldolase [Bipolaris maydis]
MNTLQEASRIYKALQKPGPTFGGWQMLPGTNLARSIARSGVDWICVDTEHGNISDSEMHEAVTAIALTGVSPLVRIASNEAWMVKLQIETRPALDHVREIAALPGVDVLLIGPFDLANNIGHPILTGQIAPELAAAIDKIKEAAHAEGKKVAIYCNSGEDARRYAQRGFDMMSVLTDQIGITGAFQASLKVASGEVDASAGDGRVKGYDGR